MAGTRETDVTLRQGDDLYAKTHRPEHAAAIVVENIDAGRGFVEFAQRPAPPPAGRRSPRARATVFRDQIRKTILQHMRMQADLRERDIKVLSLFFIDRVANYTARGRADPPPVRRGVRPRQARLRPLQAAAGPKQVREAYFAQRKGKDGRRGGD